MLKGIEIINQTEILIEQNYCNPIVDTILIILIIIGLSYILALACFVISMVIMSMKYASILRKIAVRTFGSVKFVVASNIIAFATFINIGIWDMNASRTKEIPSGEYIYEVTVSDEVSLKEFYEYYEVLDVKDDIFIIKEKE